MVSIITQSWTLGKEHKYWFYTYEHLEQHPITTNPWFIGHGSFVTTWKPIFTLKDNWTIGMYMLNIISSIMSAKEMPLPLHLQENIRT